MKRKKQNKRLLKDASEVIQHFIDHPYLLDGRMKKIHIILEEEYIHCEVSKSKLNFYLTMKEGKVQRDYEIQESPYENSEKASDSSSPSDLLN